MRDLTKYRLERTEEFLQDSKFMFENKSYKTAINRSYYAIFTAVRALLAEEEKDFKKHSAVMGYFRKNYIKTGIFETRFSDYIGDAFEVRNDCDYEDFYIASREEAETQYLHAVEFYEAIKNYLEKLK